MEGNYCLGYVSYIASQLMASIYRPWLLSWIKDPPCSMIEAYVGCTPCIFHISSARIKNCVKRNKSTVSQNSTAFASCVCFIKELKQKKNLRFGHISWNSFNDPFRNDVFRTVIQTFLQLRGNERVRTRKKWKKIATHSYRGALINMLI